MISKSENDIRTEIVTELSNRLPNLDLTEGSPERDMFIEAPLAGQLLELWNKIVYTAKLHAPHIYSTELDTVDIKNYTQNYGVTPANATYSEGIVTFYTRTEPTTNIIINDGTIVRTTESNPIEFAVQGTYTMYFSIASSYYNATTQQYEINCAVKSTVAGVGYKAAENTVTTISTSITGIDGVTNSSPITGGQDSESIDSALNRVIQKFQGRTLGPSQGLKNYIISYVEAVNVVGANDPEMERDEGLGGAIDFYVIGDDLTTVTDAVTITSTGLATGVNVLYTSTSLIFIYQPVHEIGGLIVNDVTIDPTYYTLSVDTGILAKSTRSVDKILITSTGISAGFYFKSNDTIEATYIYNALLQTIEDDLNSEANYYENRDYLLREMTPVTVDVYMEFKELAGQDWVAVASSVELAISDFINSIKNGGSVELADIVGIAKVIPAVDNIDLTTVDQDPVGGGTKTAQKDILLGKNEYPIAGTITLDRWTN
jgi:hypothetical protein